jgi:hypothetical protein
VGAGASSWSQATCSLPMKHGAVHDLQNLGFLEPSPSCP